MSVATPSLADIAPTQVHAFLFLPFRYENDPVDESRWKKEEYKIRHGSEYNESLYFYPYIRDILLSKKEDKKHQYLLWQETSEDSQTKNQFVLQIKRAQKRTLEMLLADAQLHLYPNNVGVLVLEVITPPAENLNKPKTLEDYISYFDLVRRIYISFIDADYDFSPGTQNCENKIAAVREGQCPRAIRILHKPTADIQHCICENTYLSARVACPEEDGFFSNILTYFLGPHGKDLWQPIVDDRMFVYAFYQVGEDGKVLLNNLNDYFNNPTVRINRERHWSLSLWAQLLYLDQKWLTCQNDALLQQLLKDATYTRWTKSGTFYGFCRYSAVTLLSNSAPAYIYDHFHTMYYQMALLSFFYRGSLLSFSQRSADLSDNVLNHTPELEKLHSNFLAFRNRYWFREVTAQEQGIEMFHYWRKQMDHEALMKDVEAEIQALYDYMNYDNEKKAKEREQETNEAVALITVIGACLLPLTVATGFLGMNLFSFDALTLCKGWWLFFGILLLLWGLILISIRVPDWRKWLVKFVTNPKDQSSEAPNGH